MIGPLYADNQSTAIVLLYALLKNDTVIDIFEMTKYLDVLLFVLSICQHAKLHSIFRHRMCKCSRCYNKWVHLYVTAYRLDNSLIECQQFDSISCMLQSIQFAYVNVVCVVYYRSHRPTIRYIPKLVHIHTILSINVINCHL
jgi:hypothetical protein